MCEPFLLGQQSGAAARAIDEPARTVATGGAISLMEPFIFANRTHNAPKRMDDPVPALCTGNHIALVEPRAAGNGANGKGGAHRGCDYEFDIRFPMLAPHELALAQGFEPDQAFCGSPDRAGAPDRQRGARLVVPPRGGSPRLSCPAPWRRPPPRGVAVHEFGRQQ